MQYIKISNAGILDVPVACNMLGASVKVNNDSIGMFGSGLKYALAQAMRMELDIHIASGENIYHVETRKQEFRGKIFDKVVLRNVFDNTISETPITTEFGRHDWVDSWNVYREIICNAMDEPGYKKSVVNSLRRCKTETAIYLNYEQFNKFYDNHNDYFSNNKENWMKAGTGNVFKRGVKVGTIKGISLDWQDNDVEITESRDVNEWNALCRIGYFMNNCCEANVWKHFLQSPKRDKVVISIYSEKVRNAFDAGCKKAFGQYALCPEVPQIVKDLQTVGCYPLIVPVNWTLPKNLPNYMDKVSLKSNDEIRDPTMEENELLNWGLQCASAFGMKVDFEIKIFKSEKSIQGLARNKIVFIKDTMFQEKKTLLNTLFHEIGHIDSGAGDYDRAFTSYFIDKMVDFALE